MRCLPVLLLTLAGPVEGAQLPELRRHPLALEEGEDGRWSVVSPAGGPLDTLTLAQVWYDQPSVHHLLLRERGAWAMLGAQVAAGLALGIGAIAAFDEADHYLPKRSGFAVSRRHYRDREDYLYARQQADLAYEAALAAIPEAHRMKAEDLAWTGFTLAFSATMVVGLAPAHRLRFQRVARSPDLFYERGEVEQGLELWNATHPAGEVICPAWPPVTWPVRLPGTAVRSVEAW